MENHYYLDKTYLFPYLRMQVYETYSNRGTNIKIKGNLTVKIFSMKFNY